MKALVVYESLWGNTEEVARAVADGLAVAAEVRVVEVRDAPTAVADDVDLVVAGGPTHAFSMTRANTRADALRQGATHEPGLVGLREWLAELPTGHGTTPIATFDTRVGKVRHLPGSAARSAARAARRHGFRAAAPPHSFYVEDTPGPLLEGEIDRARTWGRELAEAFAAAR
jgi:flavodoxin